MQTSSSTDGGGGGGGDKASVNGMGYGTYRRADRYRCATMRPLRTFSWLFVS